MKLFTGWVVSAGLVFTATAANAQMQAPYQVDRSPYTAVSDVGGPYAAMPPEAPRAGAPYYGPAYGPTLLPPNEVYAVLRDNGFSPLGIPRQRGLFYTIAVIDRGGDDGRLVIDARTGRIVRFTPAYRMSDNSITKCRRPMVRADRCRRSATSEACRGRRLRCRTWQAARCRCRNRRRRKPAT